MSTAPRQPPARVPTLTEVVALEEPRQAAPQQAGDAEAAGPLPAAHAPDASALHDEARRLQQALQPWLQEMLDQRLQAALQPVLEQLAEGLKESLRREIEPLLQEALVRALAQREEPEGPDRPERREGP